MIVDLPNTTTNDINKESPHSVRRVGPSRWAGC